MLDENQNPPQDKLGMTSNREVPLSLFVFIVRDGANNVVAMPQNVSLITAYTADEAVAALRQQVQRGVEFTFDLKGIMPMKNILEMFKKHIDLDGQGTPVKQEPEIIARTKKDFYKEIVEGMIKDAAAFTNTEEEKNVLLVALHKMLSLVA